MTGKKYESDVYECVDESGAPMWLYCKGHIEAEKFCQRCVRHGAGNDEEYDYIKPDDIQYATVRNIPTPPDSEWSFRIEMSEPGRGAYPITYVDFTKW